MYLCHLQESRGRRDSKKSKQKLHTACDGDRIIVFTVTSRSPWLFVKKGLLHLAGNATAEVHIAWEKVFTLSQGLWECQKPTSMGAHDGPRMDR